MAIKKQFFYFFMLALVNSYGMVEEKKGRKSVDIKNVQHAQEIFNSQVGDETISVIFQYSDLENINAVKKCKNLKYINISDTKVEDLSPLLNLHSIEEIDVSRTHINDFSPLHKLKNLKRLRLYNCQVEGLEFLKNMTSLEYLDISYTNVLSLEVLYVLPNIKKVIAIQTPIESLGNKKLAFELQTRHEKSDKICNLI